MRDSIAKRVEAKLSRSRFLVYAIKGGSLAHSDYVADFDTRKEALEWIKERPSRLKFTIIEEITGGGGKE